MNQTEKMMRFIGNVLQAWSCTADCGDFPTNFVELDVSANTYTLAQIDICLESSPAFPENATINYLNGVTKSSHCGEAQFLVESFKFGNKTICKMTRYGTSVCYSY